MEKKEKETKFKLGYNHHLTLSNLLYLVRIVSVIAMVMILVVTVIFSVKSTNTVIAINNNEIIDLLKDDKAIGYLSLVNHMNSEDVVLLINDVHNSLVLSFIYTIIPTCILFIALIFLFFGAAYLFKFTAGIKSQKTLLNKERYNLLHVIRVLIYIALVILTLMFGFGYFLILLLTCGLFEIVLYMYDSLIENSKKDK